MQETGRTYIDIMQQSLNKKLQVLHAIEEENARQKLALEDPEGAVEVFDETVEAKSRLIEQLDQLDSGFEKLFERVRDELSGNRERYGAQIEQMQTTIRRITDLSVALQKQEAQNKSLMVAKIATVKKQAKSVRTNAQATSRYSQSMMRTSVVDPQFMDDKK